MRAGLRGVYTRKCRWGAARIYPYNLGVVLEMKGDRASLDEAKSRFKEALVLDPTYSSAQQSLTALEAPETRAADASPLLVLQSNAGMLAGLKQLGLVPEHGAQTLRNLHKSGLDRLSIQQLAEVGLESLNAEIRDHRTGFEDLLCSN